MGIVNNTQVQNGKTKKLSNASLSSVLLGITYVEEVLITQIVDLPMVTWLLQKNILGGEKI